MVGRIPVMDVMPVVDLGRQPAKATVGEPFPVTATVFREGHDTLGAEVVPTGPDGVRRPPVRMAKHAESAGPLRRLGRRPTRRGRGPSRSQAWSRPGRHLAARRRAQDPRRRRRRADVHRGRAAARAGARRAGRAATRPAQVVAGRRRRGRGDADRPVEARLAALQSPELAARARGATRCASWSPSRAPTRSSPTGSARCSAAGTSSSRAPRAPPTTRRPARSPAAPSAPPPKRLDAVADDGLRRHLPAADPPDRRGQPQGPEQHPRPRARTTPARRGRSGPRTAATTPSTPTSARSTDFDAFVARAGELGLEVALDLALQAAPDHPWVRPAPGVVHHPGRRHDRLRREPAEEVPGHLPASTSTTTRAASAARCCGSSGCGCRTACGSSASTTRTPSRWRSGSGCSREVRATDPDVLFLAEAFTRPAMMQRARRDRLPPVLHLLHLAHRQVGDRGVPRASSPTTPTT